MQTSTVTLLLLALVALAAAAPTPDRDDDDSYEYDYEDYDDDDYEDYFEQHQMSLPFAVFEDLRPRRPSQGAAPLSSCAWAVVQCCDNPDPLGSRAACFAHLGCSGAWFTDICTPTIKQNILKTVLDTLRKH